MHIGAGVGALVVLGVIASILLCALLPVAIVAGVVWLVVKIAGAIFERNAGPAVAGGPPRDLAARDIGWAAGLLVTGVIWCLGRHHFAAMLLGLGTAFLTRALVERRRRIGA